MYYKCLVTVKSKVKVLCFFMKYCSIYFKLFLNNVRLATTSFLT